MGQGKKIFIKTEERMIPPHFENEQEYLIYLRLLFVYEYLKGNFPDAGAVLDFGCGTGWGAELLAQNVDKVIGLDVDDMALEYAIEHHPLDKIEFRAYDGSRIPLEDASVDAVISTHVVEHVPDDGNYVSEAYRVLKKEGVMLISTPNRELRLKAGQKPWNRFHIREYSAELLEALLKSSFNQVNIYGIRAIDEIEMMEKQRLEGVQRIVSLDPLNLRSMIPESFKPIIISLLKKMLGRSPGVEQGHQVMQKYGIKDYYLEKDNLAVSLDLLGICFK